MMHRLLLIASLAVAGCAAATRAPETALSHTFRSREELAAGFLDALERKDVAQLRRMSVDRGEFETLFWPHLPASRPETNMTPEFVWSQYALRNDAALANLLETHGGRSYRFRNISFDGAESKYGDTVVRRGSILEVVRDDGSVTRLRLFGSLVEQNNRCKIYGFVTS